MCPLHAIGGPGTYVGLIIIALGVFFAVRRLRRRGMCDCRSCDTDSASCCSCSAADDMASRMEEAARVKEEEEVRADEERFADKVEGGSDAGSADASDKPADK